MLLIVVFSNLKCQKSQVLADHNSSCGVDRWTPLTIIYPRWGLLSASMAARNLEVIVTRLAEADVILRVP